MGMEDLERRGEKMGGETATTIGGGGGGNGAPFDDAPMNGGTSNAVEVNAGGSGIVGSGTSGGGATEDPNLAIIDSIYKYVDDDNFKKEIEEKLMELRQEMAERIQKFKQEQEDAFFKIGFRILQNRLEHKQQDIIHEEIKAAADKHLEIIEGLSMLENCLETVKHAIEAKRKVLEDYDDTHEMEELKQIEAKIKAKETELAENRKNADTAEGNILRKLDELYSDLKEMIQFAEPKMTRSRVVVWTLQHPGSSKLSVRHSGVTPRQRPNAS